MNEIPQERAILKARDTECHLQRRAGRCGSRRKAAVTIDMF